ARLHRRMHGTEIVERARLGNGDRRALALRQAAGVERAVRCRGGVRRTIEIGEGHRVADGDFERGHGKLHALNIDGVIGGKGRCGESKSKRKRAGKNMTEGQSRTPWIAIVWMYQNQFTAARLLLLSHCLS